MTIDQSTIGQADSSSNSEVSRLDIHYNYHTLIGKVAFLRYHMDKEELESLKKLGIEKYLDEIADSQDLDKVSLQCMTKLKACKKRLQTYPIIYERIWRLPEVKCLQSLPSDEANRLMKTWHEEIRQIDQQLDTNYVRREVRRIEGKKSVTFSNTLQIHEYVPEPGNYQWTKLRLKKIETTEDSENKQRDLKALLLEMEKKIAPEVLVNEPGYKSLYLKVSGLVESLSGKEG